ncbi:MAG: CAP domain-containing protein, partial [Candidatus Zixiibacteriota bacterium]
MINEDREKAGLKPVELSDNIAAQIHAENMLKNYYLSHWDTNGSKPYMQYTQHGGLAFVSQNCGWYVFYYEGPLKKSLNPNLAIAALEYDMVYDDASSNWGHRDNILDKWHNKVSIGIAYDETHLALVQNFENDYITWNKKIEYSNGTISLSGKTSLGELQAIAIYYDP